MRAICPNWGFGEDVLGESGDVTAEATSLGHYGFKAAATG